jgi:hypothetical protein
MSSTSSSRPDRVRQIITFLAILAAFVVNILSNIAPPNGVSVGELSNTVFGDVYIIPANYAFAIWGLIYIGLFAFGFYQLSPAQRDNVRLRRIGYWLVVACVAQIAWIYIFLARAYWLSVVAMFVILGSLIMLYLQLHRGNRATSRKERWSVDIPFSVYLGWISVATVVNVAIALFNAEWNGWGLSPIAWTIVMAIVATVLGVLMVVREQDAAFPLVIVWALVAIALHHTSLLPISITTAVLAIALLLVVLFRLVFTGR